MTDIPMDRQARQMGGVAGEERVGGGWKVVGIRLENG